MSDTLTPAAAGSQPRKSLDLAEPPSLPSGVLDHLGLKLRSAFLARTRAPLPTQLSDLVAKLDSALVDRNESAAAFRAGLTAAIPGLRAFALSLARSETQADDLVQETVLRAWANQDKFKAGSNLKAWLCTILRNQFYTDRRKGKREIEDADGAEAARLIAPANQEHEANLKDLWAAMAKLPVLQREALLLVGAEGMTYEEVAKVVGCQIGTVKSRVSRARAFVAGLLATKPKADAT